MMKPVISSIARCGAFLAALLSGAAFAQIPPAQEKALVYPAEMSELQRKNVDALLRQNAEMVNGAAGERIRRSHQREMFWGEGLYSEIIDHPACKGLKSRVVEVSKGRPYDAKMSRALIDLRLQAMQAGCIPRPFVYRPGARRQ